MYGFSAISAASGWSMAVLGASIVFSGLVLLSIAISLFPKLLNLMEPRETETESDGAEVVKPASVSFSANICPHPDYCPEDIHEVARIWSPLVEQLDTPFQLTDLYRLSKENDFPHPHLTISRLRDAEIIMPAGENVFMWNSENIEKG